MKKLALYWQILIAFALSVLYGLFFSEHVHLVAWMGDIFIKALKDDYHSTHFHVPLFQELQMLAVEII